MKQIKILHLFPNLLSLYGEYANIAVLRRALENNGCHITVDSYENGELHLDSYDMVYVGAGTEDNLLEAIRRLMPYQALICDSIEKETIWLATGNAMTLFGRSVSQADGTMDALGCFAYSTDIRHNRRYLGDVLTETAFGMPLIGFINTSCAYHGIDTPLLRLKLNGKLGSNKQDPDDGILHRNFYGTQLIGPVLAKNPHFLQHICKKLLGFEIPSDPQDYAHKAYAVALNELSKRTE